uniref:Uncharacterized protein n=1 Tax=Aegilops tauschii subsp. strangulata TaxID=200361 RepID=A0A453ECR7_AEGTS
KSYPPVFLLLIVASQSQHNSALSPSLPVPPVSLHPVASAPDETRRRQVGTS